MQQLWEWSENLWMNSTVNKDNAEGREGGGPGAGGHSPAACGEDLGDGGGYLELVENSRGAGVHLQPMRDPTPEHWHGLKETEASEEPVLEQAPDRSSGERSSCWGSGLWRNLSGAVHSWRTSSMERTHAEIVHKVLSPMGRTPHWSRGRAWGRRRSRGGISWVTTTIMSISCPPAPLMGSR